MTGSVIHEQEKTMSLTLRAALAAVALIVPVSAELIWPSVGDSAHLLFAAAQLIGWVLVATVVRDGASRHPATSSTRAGRVGRRLLLSGCALQVLFALVYGGSAVIDGEPAEASFLLFLLGFLATFVGGVVWGPALLRAGLPRLAGVGVLATAVLGLLAIAVGVDPFHDVFLLSSYAAWVLVGRGLDAPAHRRERSSEVSAASR
jgi:hypothetical protein